MSQSKKLLFISYRRKDAGGHAGRLFDRLRHWFDDDVLFYDVKTLDMGDSFREDLDAAVDASAVMLVVMAPDWLDEINRRAREPGVDFVRREVERALERGAKGQGPLIVPVLMGGAAMPSPEGFHEALGPRLSELCTLQAHSFQATQADWDAQFVRLRDRVAQLPGMPPPRFRFPAGVEQPFRVIDQSVSPHFQDPGDILALLRAGFEAQSARVALHGMGGVGKTQMALQYSHQYRDRYAGVWWFRSESDTTLQLDARECCARVHAPINDGQLPSVAFKRWTATQPKG